MALSSTEAKYIALSRDLREQIPLLELLREILSKGIDIHLQPPVIKCRALESNSGALEMEMAKLPKIHCHTKHLNINHHHFHDHVECSKIEVVAVPSEHQVTDILTKPLLEALFV